MAVSAIDPPIANPEALYLNPEVLANDPLLARDRKLELLERWEFSVNARLAAADEGMPISAAREGRESEMIKKIDCARKLILSH